MSLIPEWMSNVHPLIVHFPVALLVIAVLADFLSLILKRYDWIRPAALWLYVFGALGTVAAYITGKQAADIVNFPAPSYPVISKHADLALYTMLFFSIYALIRLLFAWRKWDQRTAVSIVLFIVAAAGLGLVQQTAEHGGELVFRYGVGTNVQTVKDQPKTQKATNDLKIPISENGSWLWQASPQAAQTLRENFRLVKGSWEALKLQTIKSAKTGNAVAIETRQNQSAMFTYGPLLKNVQLTARLNTDGFNGRFFLVHHVSSQYNYDFLAWDQGKVRLGRIDNGTLKIFDEASVNATGWVNLKVVGSSGHYRGYVNEKLLVHGHSSDLSPGQTGFALSGSGRLQLSEIATTSLDSEAPMMNMGNQNMSHDSQESGNTH